MNLTKNALYLEEEKILEIIKITKNIKNTINEQLYNYKNRQHMSNNDKIRKAISIYQNATHTLLNDEEKTIVALYTIITNDDELDTRILDHNSNFQQVGHIYGVSKEFIKLRWLIQIKVKIYEKKLKKLKLENKQKKI